jgi:chaperone BCS1
MKDRKGNRIKCLNPHSPQNLVIECFPTLQGTAPIQDFLREVSRASNQVKPVEIETTVYRSRASHQASNDENYDMGAWVAAITRPARPIESVALETSKKNALVDDIAEFLTIECKLFYANRGLPYRRGFLLYGPPGTGKTSFCLAIAGHFNLPVYIVSLSSKEMSDQQLEILFDELPSPCILLLEDVDSAGLERELTPAEQKRVARGAAKPPLTLSGLLNCLDGPTSKDGRIVSIPRSSVRDVAIRRYCSVMPTRRYASSSLNTCTPRLPQSWSMARPALLHSTISHVWRENLLMPSLPVARSRLRKCRAI